MLSKVLKILSFGCVCLIIPVLAVATVLEKIYGAEFAREHVYVAIPVIILWGTAAFFSLWYMLRVNLYKKAATFSIHLSLILILIGALITHSSGKQGKIHLRIDEPSSTEFVTDQGKIIKFPFEIELSDFHTEFYPGTFSPSDFISKIKITDRNGTREKIVSMNNIQIIDNYRFYQSGYDADNKGSFLTVSFDPYGIAITYSGYVWLLLSIFMFFLQKKSLFRKVLKSDLLRNGLTVVIIISGWSFMAHAQPLTVPKSVAEDFGKLLIYYNGRVAPLNTFALEFNKKIYGKAGYRGLTPEQVIAGWLFFYDDWKNEPIIKIKGAEVKSALGKNNSYVSLADFIGKNGYKLDQLIKENGAENKNVIMANEKFNLVSSLVTGSLLKIYPYKIPDESNIKWYSIIDKPEEDMPYDQWLFIRNSMSLVAERVALEDWSGASELLKKIRKYQDKEGGELLPYNRKIKAEYFYNSIDFDKPLAMICLTIGIILFFYLVLNYSYGKGGNPLLIKFLYIIIGLVFLYLTLKLSFRGYISNHLPLSNGFETMQLMAWLSCLAALCFTNLFRLILPFGFLLSGFSLLVAMMGEASPQITNLMPVLQSPLLSIHVMVIMIAYSLLAFMMFDGIAALIFALGQHNEKKIIFLQQVSRLLLYPGVFLLGIGIFLGAVWANVSWGRYWGWDPKEVWALITFLIYALAIHCVSLPRFRNPIFFHAYSILAFMSVIITYFGVNFFLGGLHSYA